MNQVIQREQIQHFAPAVYGRPWEGASDRYAYVPTYEVLDLMEKEGFLPTKVNQVGSSVHAKHMVRLRHRDHLNPKEDGLGQLAPEIVMINSHDGKSSFQIMSGLFRLICLNGMVVNAGLNQDTKIRHFGSAEEVVEAVYGIVRETPAIMNEAQEMSVIELTPNEQNIYAVAARELRWPKDEDKTTSPDFLLKARRTADRKDDLWSTFSRVQENMIKGGMPVVQVPTELGVRPSKPRKAKKIKSIQEDLRINKSLWILTQRMKELKLAA